MTKIITALLTGIIIGVLIAPDSGAATRRKLSDLLADTGEDAEDFIDESRELIENKLSSTKSAMESI